MDPETTLSLVDFDRWLAQLAATGLHPSIPAEVERLRAVLAAGGTATIPALIPYTCNLCGQHITDGKPCGCGARR